MTTQELMVPAKREETKRGGSKTTELVNSLCLKIKFNLGVSLENT